MLTIKAGAAPSGFIRFADRYYSIYGLSENYAILVKHDLTAYDDDDDDIVGEVPSPPSTPCNDTSFVDILILETPAARAQLNLMPASFLTNAFATINFALFQSDVSLRYVRFQRHYSTFTPTGGSCIGIDILTNDFPNNSSSLDNLRSTYKVDGIILLTTCLDQAGWSVPGLNIQRPYAVVDLAHVMGPRFSLAHEFGHLFSALHNKVSNGGDVPNNDPTIKHGWRFFDADSIEQWTIMAAFPDPGRILHYSNPDVSFNGVPTGTATDNNALSAATVGMCFMAQNEPQMPPVLTVQILGNTTLCDTSNPSRLSAFVTGPSPGVGMGPFNYEWRWSKQMITATNPGTVVGTNSPLLWPAAALTCEGKYYLQLKVTNPIWGIERKNIRVIDPGLCTLCPDFVSTAVVELNNPEISLSVVPNPARDLVTLDYKILGSEAAFLEIFRTDGHVLKTAKWIAAADGYGVVNDP